MSRRRSPLLMALGLLAGCGENHRGPSGHVIEIDIDDHGLAGLWMASAPNLKALIARGTLAFSRVDVPTHSNQNNMTLLTGQYPDGHDVPSNAWLSRAAGFTTPVSLPGLAVGDYAIWNNNPLRTRGDSIYGAVRDAQGRSAYVGELPPFEVGADEVHLSVVGTSFGPITVTQSTAEGILTQLLGYPPDVTSRYHFDGPPAPGESQLRFTLRDAADLVRASGPDRPMPACLFVWDFIALDSEAAGNLGSDGAGMSTVIEDYDAGLGDLLRALSDKGLLESTNILFTLDHGKVDTHNQVALGTRGADATSAADGQLADVVAARGATFGVDTHSYALLNEDGDALLYARVDGAGTAAAAAAQIDVTHRLVALVQSGAITGVDTTRTMTADGWLGTRRFHDFRANGPNQADLIVFPQDDWTLNQVNGTNMPGPFQDHGENSYARHGGFSVDELYVPLILAGPAFKSGVLLPHPVEHADVAPTALAALGGAISLRTAARGPIHAALIGDPGETISLPSPPDGARDLVLSGSGFGAAPPLATPVSPATSAVIIDVAGLYEEEVFADPLLAAAAAPLRDLASRGTRFEDCWTRSRDWPITEYQMLTGGYPVAPWVPAPEDDPTQTFGPGAGLLAMPPPTGRIANQGGYDAWRTPTRFAGESLFDAAHALGLTTALLGDRDFHALHIDTAPVDVAGDTGGASVGDQLTALAADHPRFLALVAIGGGRVANRHDRRAIEELDALAKSIVDLAARVPNALVAVISRGATTIDDPGSDFYGAGSSRHVPLVLIGPGVRAGVVSGQPAAPADLPATLLFGLGAATSTDFALGTWATGTPVGAIPQPMPSGATAGHALLRAFSLVGR
jgi:Type I phosphodiesterase / nucleotide pyrophosphatase